MSDILSPTPPVLCLSTTGGPSGYFNWAPERIIVCKHNCVAGGKAVFMNGFEPPCRIFGGDLSCGDIAYECSEVVRWLTLA